MESIKDLISEGPIHTRRIEVRTYPATEDRLVVEGRLQDERLVTQHRWNGATDRPGMVHSLVVRFLMGGWPPTILKAEAEMPAVPHELCSTTLDTVHKLEGLAVVPGYGEEIRKTMGGIKGCTHLTALIMAMGVASLHGAWVQRSRQPGPPPKSPEDFAGLDQLVNSCFLWREDGPIMDEVRRQMQGALGTP